MADDLTEDFFFSNFKLKSETNICIVIPVKDEEIYIVNTLSAFGRQVKLNGDPIDFCQFEILLLANNFTDQSVIYIKNFQRQNSTLNIHLVEIILPPHEANIGYVRRLLMESAYKRLSQNGGGIIMTTDGDTIVAQDWIAQTELEIKKGADAVGGRILLYADELERMDQSTRRFHLQDEEYHLLIAELEAKILQHTHDPAPKHHQHFNGSFAVTSECYQKSGGIPHVY